MGLSLVIVGLWKGIEVGWLGHIMSLGFWGMSTFSLLLMWLARPKSNPSITLSQVDTGKSTDWVQLPKLFTKRNLLNRPVDKLPTVFEEGGG